MASRSRRVGLILGVGVLAAAAVLAPAASQAPDPRKAQAQEQLALVRQALGALDRMYKNGTVTAYDPRFVVWERRRVEAIRDAGANHAEFIAALEGYVKSLRDRQRLADMAVQQAAAPGVELIEAKYRVLEAEM